MENKNEDVTRTVITPEEVNEHTINKYDFRGIQEITTNQQTNVGNVNLNETSSETSTESYESVPTSVDSKRLIEITEAVLKKAEELSTNLKSVESELKEQKIQFQSQLEEAKKRSYDDGFKAGVEDTNSKFSVEIEEIKKRFLEGVNSLEGSVEQSHTMMDTLEKELSSIALDIAKEVILIEVNKNSQDIAKELAESLMQNIKEATKITLKVNPEDFKFLKENLAEDVRVKIESNSAIAKGGVVVVSDIGNIDGSVMTRFSNIKTSIVEAQSSSEV